MRLTMNSHLIDIGFPMPSLNPLLPSAPEWSDSFDQTAQPKRLVF
jgi:hypothetical protein